MAVWHIACHADLMISDRKEADGMHQDDRGFTLIEILMAITISAIVVLSATLFIRNALKSYGAASDVIDIQIEGQVLMEQIATWAMEGNLYEAGSLDGTDSDHDVFIIRHKPRDAFDSGYEDLMGKSWIRVFWHDKDEDELYMCDMDSSFFDKTVDEIIDKLPDLEDDKKNLFSDYVEDFVVTHDEENSPNKVSVTLSLKVGIQECELRNEIKMRNALYDDGGS